MNFNLLNERENRKVSRQGTRHQLTVDFSEVQFSYRR